MPVLDIKDNSISGKFGKNVEVLAQSLLLKVKWATWSVPNINWTFHSRPSDFFCFFFFFINMVLIKDSVTIEYNFLTCYSVQMINILYQYFTKFGNYSLRCFCIINNDSYLLCVFFHLN